VTMVAESETVAVFGLMGGMVLDWAGNVADENLARFCVSGCDSRVLVCVSTGVAFCIAAVCNRRLTSAFKASYSFVLFWRS